MKAYVIKNKEGKYYQRCYNQSPFTDNLFDANKYQYKEEAEKLLNNSFTIVDTLEVVEITIAEVDLEQKIAVLERALKNTCRLLYGTYDEHYPNCFIKQAEKELKGERDE